MLSNQAKWAVLVIVVLISGVLVPLSARSSLEKRLLVISNEAEVHLDPDLNSPVLDVLKKGMIIKLGSERKFRKDWHYVYYKIGISQAVKAGYIRDDLVKELFQVTKVITIQGENDSLLKTSESDISFAPEYWGIHKDEVVRIEGNPLIVEKKEGFEQMDYYRQILEKDCLVSYFFVQDMLVQVRCRFLSNNNRENSYIDEFTKMKDLLVEKLGPPYDDSMDWNNSLNKEQKNKWDEAVSIGHLQCRSWWKNNQTEIFLHLFGEKSFVCLDLNYLGVKQKPLLERIKVRASLEEN